jgi:O-antigen/teichoic acid export membrane protein
MILIISTGAGQLVTLLASPLLTRLLGPSSFGLLALYAALVSILGMAVSGRYDIAALLPGDDSTAREVLGLALWVSLGIVLLCALLTVICGDVILRLFAAEALGRWIYLVPLGLWLTGLRVTLGYWANRRGAFVALGTAQFLQASIAALVGVLLGALGSKSAALLTGYIAGLGVSALVLAYQFRADLRPTTLRWSRAKVELAHYYNRFPLFSASSAIVDAVCLSLPVLFLSHYFGSSTVGYYAMVVRVASAPLSLISSSVSQVHLGRLTELVRSESDGRPYFLRLAGRLALLAAAPTIVLMPVSPWLFARIFGAEWRVAGEYLQILMPSFAVRFVASSLSITTEATNNSHLGALWKVCAVTTSAAVLYFWGRAGNAHRLMIVICISDIVLYVFYFYLQYCAVSNPRTRGL